jgi:Flp pilus assembly protein TadD
LQQTSYGQDPTRWGVGYSFDSEVEPGWEETWVDDLRSELARHGFDPIPIGSEKDQRLGPGCLAWRIEASGRRNASGEADTLVQVWRRGTRETLIHRPSAPGEIQEGVARELREILGIATPTSATRTMDPESLEANREGLALYMAGDLGAAEKRLARAVERNLANPKLRNNLALVLFDRALQLRLRAESGEGISGETRREIDELLDQALRHLDRAIAEDAGNASYHYDRGRILQFLGHLEQAEVAFEEALEHWPTFPEAANDLAALLLDEGQPDRARRASDLLETALAHVDPGDFPTRAAILKNLSRAHRALGNLDAAWQALDTADCLTLRETFGNSLEPEILALSAGLQSELLGPASAAVAWRRYGAVLAWDTDVGRRRQFFDWRMSHLHHPGQLSDADRWVGRCLKGHFETRGFP